jgi:hypothetical protein
MATYYVHAGQGTDDGAHGDGKGTDAWATLAYAITQMGAGDKNDNSPQIHLETNIEEGVMSFDNAGQHAGKTFLIRSDDLLNPVIWSSTSNTGFVYFGSNASNVDVEVQQIYLAPEANAMASLIDVEESHEDWDFKATHCSVEQWKKKKYKRLFLVTDR